MAINPLAYTEKVVRSFLRYQLTTYPFADTRLNAQMRELLSLDHTRETPLLKGPFLSLSRAFEAGASKETLIEEGVLHPHLAKIIEYPSVYGHQEDAIRAISAGKTTLVSTGTGSGKSECFLYPIISRCLELRDAGAPPGICAVIVYPMNALAEDQLGRLRGLLAGSGISFGMYVGKTPRRQADVTGIRLPAGSSHADYVARVAGLRERRDPTVVHPPEELCSREMMRKAGQQPRILLTNTKQLELLLTRQEDVELFHDARLDYLVFDEAHTFSGAGGAESACLVRRLRSFCGREAAETVCVATSATIVDEENPEAARDFASRFFGVAQDKIVTVNERYEPDVWARDCAVPDAPADPAAALESARQAVETADGSELREFWRSLAGGPLPDGDWEAALHAALSANALLKEAADLLLNPLPMEEVLAGLKARIHRDVCEEELILWLTLGAAARTGGRPLVRPVVHGFVRGVPGAVVTFELDSDEPTLHLSAEDEAPEDEDRLRMKVSSCTTCGQHYFEHSLADFEYTGGAPGGGQVAADGGTFWEPLDETLGGVRTLFLDSLISQEDDEEPAHTRLCKLQLCRSCGAVHQDEGDTCAACGVNTARLPLYAVRQKAGNAGKLSSCACCGATGRRSAGWFREPAKPVRATNVADVHVLAQDMVHHAERERLLVFADNRQDAAFQAGWMRDHARRFRLRALMMEELAAGPLSVGDLAHRLDTMLEQDNALSQALVPEVWAQAQKEAAGRVHRENRLLFLRIQLLLELSVPGRQQIGLEPWGQIKVEYCGLKDTDAFVQRWARALRIPADELKGGIEDILDRVRRRKQLHDSMREIFSKFQGKDNTERQSGFIPDLPGVPKGLKLRRAATDDRDRVDQWLSEGHQTTMSEAARKWGVEPDQIGTFVSELWKYLTHPDVAVLREVTLKGQRGNPLPNCHGTCQVDGDRLLIHATSSGFFRCTTCRRRTVRRTPHKRCLAWRCDGELKHEYLDDDNYDLHLVQSKYTMLRPREHTAMVPSHEREKLEQIFKGKSDQINVLVCTQTLEMGVDIGALDAVLMRNVPPRPANYWQRAGRAGRRHRMAVNLTYCRQVNHDRAYFDDPLKILAGRVDPPSFNMANELMIAKHVHATVITTLYRLTRPQSGLADADRLKIGEALRSCLPRLISPYLFDPTGALLLKPFDVSELTEAIAKFRGYVEPEVLRAFQQEWPTKDADAVTTQKLAGHISTMGSSLQGVVDRLFRRLRWATHQLDELERVRKRFGALDDEQESFYYRCRRFVKKMKGVRRRGRREAEGVDDIVTYGVLAAEGFLPGYGLETGTVLGMAQVPPSVVGLEDFDLPRPPAVALREYVPGNLIYANGQRFVARRFYRDVEEGRSEELQLQVTLEREAIHEVRGHSTGDMAAAEVAAIPICDALLLHQSRISDEEENRFQMGVSVYGRELGQHNGGQGFRWGDRGVLLRKSVRLQLVNVGSTSIIRTRQELGYPVCRVCGQSVSPYSSERQREDFKAKHLEQCGRKADGVAFYANLAVDALTIRNCENRIEAYSLAEGLRQAASEILEMELEDLLVLVIGQPDCDAVDAHLYDPMPGGSGLLEQICERFGEVVKLAQELADGCPGLCEHSCIDCFQNYRNAFYHKHLDRFHLRDRLNALGPSLTSAQPIPAQLPAAGAAPDRQPGNMAEQKLKTMLASAGFPGGVWQLQRPLPRPLISTTPDITFDDPDDDESKLFVYLDGLSKHLHGNPETAEMDGQIRAELRSQGHEVLEITVHDLDDQQQMTRYFKKLARFLLDRAAAKDVAARADDWFASRTLNETAPDLDAEKPAQPEPVAKSGPEYPFELLAKVEADEQWTRCVPCYDLQAAAGAFSDYQQPEELGWAAFDRLGGFSKQMFVGQVVGKSMEPRIPDGSWCLFQLQPAGSRHNRILLVQHHAIEDPDHGGRYTVKTYHRPPQPLQDGQERTGQILLKPLNPDYQDIPVNDAEELCVIAEVIQVLPSSPGGT